MAAARRNVAIRIGTRGSKLALAQAQRVADALRQAQPGLVCEIVQIRTTGDRRRTEPLAAIGGTGLFTRELEHALLDGRIDMAVHSLKDLPTRLPEGLALAGIPERAPANDAVISADGRPLWELPSGARVGTSSPRRVAQLLRARPDLRPEPIRGNLDTRLRKLREGRCDAICVALAGLIRIGLAEEVSEVLPLEVMLPAPGQGALAIEARADDRVVADLAARIGQTALAGATAAERGLLEALGGGCSLPLGAYAEQTGPDALRLRAVVLSPDGGCAAQADATGTASKPLALAQAAARELRANGSDAILAG